MVGSAVTCFDRVDKYFLDNFFASCYWACKCWCQQRQTITNRLSNWSYLLQYLNNSFITLMHRFWQYFHNTYWEFQSSFAIFKKTWLCWFADKFFSKIYHLFSTRCLTPLFTYLLFDETFSVLSSKTLCSMITCLLRNSLLPSFIPSVLNSFPKKISSNQDSSMSIHY